MANLSEMSAIDRFIEAVYDRRKEFFLTDDMKSAGVVDICLENENTYQVELTYVFKNGTRIPGPVVAEYVDGSNSVDCIASDWISETDMIKLYMTYLDSGKITSHNTKELLRAELSWRVFETEDATLDQLRDAVSKLEEYA